MAVTESTCIYLIKDGKWLMLLRNRKDHDINKGKWIGIGGKKEKGETWQMCAMREAYEESGLSLHSLHEMGHVHFHQDGCEDEHIVVYTCNDFRGTLKQCCEGTLKWIEEKDILSLNLWPGDRIFLSRIIENERIPFDLYLTYDADGNLIENKEKTIL